MANLQEEERQKRASLDATLKTRIREHEVAQEKQVSEQTREAQQKLAETLKASTPVVTENSFKPKSLTPNTPFGNQQNKELSAQLEQSYSEVAARQNLEQIFAQYQVNDPQVQTEISNDAEQISQAITEINKNNGFSRDQIDLTNNALIDFHEHVQEQARTYYVQSLQSQSEVVQPMTQEKPHEVEQQVQPLSPQVESKQNVQASPQQSQLDQQDIDKKAKEAAKALADEVTANVIRRNRQIEYLRQLDEIHRRKEDEARKIETKTAIEEKRNEQTQDLSTTKLAINLTPEAQKLIEERHEQKKFELGIDGNDNDPPFDNDFSRNGGGGGDGVEFEQVEPPINDTQGQIYAGVASFDEDGRAATDHTDIRVLGSGVQGEAKLAGIDKGENAQKVTVIEGQGDVKTVGIDPSARAIDRSLDRRFGPNQNN